jgi:hypothetical protein
VAELFQTVPQNDLEDYLVLSFILGAFVGAILLAYCGWQAERSSPIISGEIYELRYPRSLRVGALVGLLFSFLVVVMASYAQTTSAYVIATVLLLCGFYGLVETWTVRVFFNTEQIWKTSFWQRRRSISWKTITNCHFSEVNKWYVLRSRNETIRVSVYLGGINAFEEAVLRLAPPETLDEDEPSNSKHSDS